MSEMPRIALLLPGGGARSAWQVGVLRAIAGWYPPGSALPFPVVCGTSAGAINAAVLAAGAADFVRASEALARVWGGFRTGQVFRAGTLDMLRSGLHLLLALVSGGWLLPMPRSLLDNSPLGALLAREVNFGALARAVTAGRPDSVAVTATSLSDAESVTFVQTSRPFSSWEHVGRRGTPAALGVEHLMASAAIPLLFPPVAMAGSHYGDGALRQSTPFAPAIHLGADRVLVIGVRHPGVGRGLPGSAPNIAEQFGFMLDSLFIEGLQADLERLNRINALLVGHRPGPVPFGMRHVETLVLQPERDPVDAALAHRDAMPASLRALLRILGARGARGGRLISYLLFESAYTRELIAAGEHAAARRRAEISAFLGLDRAYGARID
ncbi:MAG: patatin-like phospholipase family protein [Gammaproteobacteria bacterium]|nr:patatin-like phospholipase family protein [Gammaproteobacteria bacterium]